MAGLDKDRLKEEIHAAFKAATGDKDSPELQQLADKLAAAIDTYVKDGRIQDESKLR
jgi:hypothetical protein